MSKASISSAKWSNRWLAVFFSLAILLPLAAQLAPGLQPATTLRENRTLATRPALGDTAWTDYPSAFTAYFDDNFGYRQLLIRLNNLMRYRVFNVSAVPRVLAGQDGWLFYNGVANHDGNPSANHRGDFEPFGEHVIESLKFQIENIRDHFARHGLDYMLVVAPDKWSIYPEYLPPAYQAPGTRSCVDQFVQYLQANSTIQVLDLRHCLIAAKNQPWPVYLRTDTHWSDYGAFVGANEILTSLRETFPRIQPLVLDDYIVSEVPVHWDGLASLMGLRGLLGEKTWRITPRDEGRVLLSVPRAPKPQPLTATQDRPDLPRAIMLRDSFAHALAPYFSTGFSRIEYVWTPQARHMGLGEEISRVKPDIVIEMKVERYMLDTTKYYRPMEIDFADD